MYIVFSEIKIQMRIKLSNALVYLMLLLSFGLSASHEEITTILSINERTVISGQDMLVFEDVNRTFDVNDFKSPYSVPPFFKRYPKQTLNFGFAHHDVWIVFALENPSKNIISGYLKFDNPILDSIDIYNWNIESEQFKLVQTIGDQVKNTDGSIKNRNLITQIEVQPHETRFFLVRINNGGEQFHFSLTYQTNLLFQEEDHFHQFFFGIYFGILIFVLIFNIFLYFSIKEKLSLYYVCYLFSLGVLQLSLNGFGKEFIWPSSGYLANHINPIFASAGIYFLLLFVREFLQLSKLMPRIDTAFKWFGYLVVFNIALSAIPNDSIYQLSVLIINGLTLVLTLAIIPVAFYALKKQFKPARYFIAAFLLLVFAVGAFVLKNFGVIESNNFSNYGLQYGSALEVILLSVAIIDRFKQFREQSIKRLNELNVFRKKVNEELEQKVKDRTIVLHETLSQLEVSKDELAKALEKEKEVSDLKSRFVSTVSHEFRTPLSTILTSASLIKSYVNDALKRERHVHRIEESVTHMNAMLEDLLSLGKLEEGLIEVRRDIFDINEFLGNLTQEMAETTKRKNPILYSFEGIKDVNTDKRLVKNILINLISNAVKFSEAGKPVSVVAKANQELITISVTDAGIGISEEDQKHLFTRFFRGQNAANIKGTGLGLHIVTKYLELLDGSISLSSKLDEGTTFTITIQNAPVV